MKKIVCIFLCLFLIGCEKKVELNKHITLEFYTVVSCGACKVFKSDAIPYFKKRYGNKISIKVIDIDEKKNMTLYDNAIKTLKDFDDEYYGMSPFIYIKGYMAYLGYNSDDEKYIAQDIENALNNKKVKSQLEGHRFDVK